jgi:hypothetical protein
LLPVNLRLKLAFIMFPGFSFHLRWARALLVLALNCCLTFGGLVRLDAAGFEGHIVDDATSKPAFARVAVTDINGKFLEIDGQHSHVQYLDKRWCYVDGSFRLQIPDSGAFLEIRRGLETRPESLTISPGEARQPIQKTFRLRRWIDMRKNGYLSGDVHAHAPAPAEARWQMQAEDLNALNLLQVTDPAFSVPANGHFTGRLDTNSTPGCELYVGQEIQEWQMGHVNLVGLIRLVDGYPNMGGGLEYWKSAPHWDLMRGMQAARAQQATIIWAHLCSLPGEQLPVAAALGYLDAIELITWNDPAQLPNHWDPWENSGMTQAEFPVMRPVDLYYQFLNAGFRIPVAAGTDKLAEDIPLGSNRTYVRVQEPAGYDSWLAAIKSGRSFASNGPLLDFEAADHRSGDVVEFHGAKRIKARVTARSLLPFTTLEIVLNGAVIAHRTVPIPAQKPTDGIYSMTVEADVELTRSGWLAARVIDHPDLPNRILPRGVSVFAHTSPVYFLCDGRNVREPASIAYLQKWVKGLQHWLQSDPPFGNDPDKQNARQTADEALRFYQGL